jgi:hypothetical protein
MPDNEPWTRVAPSSDLKAVDQNQPMVQPTEEPWARVAPTEGNTYPEKPVPNYRDKSTVEGEMQMGIATSEDKKSYLQSLYSKVSDSNANDNADALEISKKTGIDPDKVLNNLKEAKSVMSGPDKEYWDNLQDRSPGLARFLEDPKNMAACHNSLQGLSDAEGKIKDLYKGTLKMGSFALNALDAPNQVLKSIAHDDYSDPSVFESARTKLDEYIKTISTPVADDASWQKAYKDHDYNALAAKLTTEIPNIASLILSTVATGGFGTAAYLGAGTLSESYEESKKNGLSDEMALASATAKGGITAATMLPVLNVFSKTFPAVASFLGNEGAKTTYRIAFTNFAKSTLGMSAQNDAQLFGDSAVDKISGENPKAFENFGNKLAESTIGGLTIGAVMGVPHFLGAIGNKSESDVLKNNVKYAEDTKRKLIELSKSIPEMNTEMAQKAIKAFTDQHGAENVRIPVEEFERLYQEEGPENVAKQFGEEALKSYQEPGSTEVVIPMEKFLTSERKSDVDKLSDSIKINPQDKTVAQLKADVQKKNENESELQKIKNEFKNKSFGETVAAGYKTFSERTGKSVKELRDMFGFEESKEHAPVISEDKQKEIFGVSAPEKFFQSDYDNFFKKNNVSEKDIKDRQRQLEGMKAAVKDPETGRIFTATTGTEGHFAAFEQARFAGYKNVTDKDAGFLLGDGKFVNRDEANEKFGILRSGQIPETQDARDFILNRKPISEEENAMFNQKNRGAMQPAYDPLTKKMTFKVLLNENSDKSTMFHEIGHAFLFMMKHLSELEGAPKDLKEDSESFFKWVGAKSWDDVFSKEGGKYTKEAREMHEKFARGFEYRLWEGDVPVPGMKRMFDRFMNWVREVYPTANIMQRYLGVEMTPRMRGVYDRILASKDEIKKAEKDMGYNSESPEGVDPNEMSLWTARYAKATQDAIDINLKTKMKSYMEHGEDEDVARAKAEKDINYRSVEEVIEQKIRNLIPYDNVEESHAYALAEDKATKEVDADPKYKMIDDFGFKNYKEEAQKFIDGDRSKQDLLTSLAIKYGYEDASEVAKVMVNADKKYEISEKIKTELGVGKPLAYNSDTAGKISTLYGDARSEALSAELNLYKRMSNEDIQKTLAEVSEVKKQTQAEERASRGALKEKAKEQARINLSGKGLTEAKSYSTYITASKNSAIKASEYANKKDYKNAAIWKEKELINHEMAKQAIRNAEIIGKFESKAKDLADRTSIDNRPLLTVPVGHAKIAHGLLEKFGLADKVKPQPGGTWESMADNMEGKSQKEISDATGMTGAQGSWKPETVSSFLSRLKSEGLEHAGLSDYVPVDLLESKPIDKNSLTLDELSTVVNAVSAIYTDGRHENVLLNDKTKTNLKEINKSITDAIKANVGDSHSDRAKELKHWWTSVGDKTLLEMGQIETLAEIIDGGPDGPAHKFFTRPLRDCDNKERELTHERVKSELDIAEKHFGKDGIGKRMNETVSVDVGNGKMRDFTIGQLYGVMRYIGNVAGKADIIKGNGFDEATIERMKDKLTEKDMDYISDISKEDEKFWPKFVAQELRAHGVAPKPVEKVPVTFKGKMYEGWYYHKSYDKDFGTDVKPVEVSRPDQMNSFKPFDVNNGFLKNQIEKGTGKALNLNPEVHEQYIKDTCHYLAWQEGIRDANKILKDKNVKTALEDAFTVRGASVFQTQVNYLACGSDDAKGMLDKLFRYGRVTSIFYNIGYRAPMFLVKYGSDVNNIFWEKGVSHASNILFGYGINPWSGKLDDLVKKVQELEPSMKYRSEMFSYDSKALHEALSGKNKLLSFIEHTTFITERSADKIVSHVEWYRVYSDAIKEGKNEETAKYMASETVDNLLGSASKLQHTGVMRGGELTKSFSPAYQVFATMYNRAYKMGKQVGPAYDSKGFLAASAVVARMIVRFPLMMSLIGFGSSELLRNISSTNGNKNDEEQKKRLWEKIGTSALELAPGGKNLASFAYRAVTKKSDAFKPALHLLPLEQIGEDAIYGLSNTEKMIFNNNEFKKKDAEEMIKFYSEVSHVPKLIDTWAENLYDDIAENGNASIKDLLTRKTRY